MKTWHVTIKIEATLEVEAETMEQAEREGLVEFDATAYDREVVDAWTDDEEGGAA